MTTQQFDTLRVSPVEIKKGDRLTGNHGWEATEDAKTVREPGGKYTIKIPVAYFPDGGRGVREWDDDTDVRFQIERAVDPNPTETFTLHIDVKGKENIERISDALQTGGDANLLIEIERLLALKASGNYAETQAIMDSHFINSSDPVLESFTVRED